VPLEQLLLVGIGAEKESTLLRQHQATNRTVTFVIAINGIAGRAKAVVLYTALSIDLAKQVNQGSRNAQHDRPNHEQPERLVR